MRRVVAVILVLAAAVSATVQRRPASPSTSCVVPPLPYAAYSAQVTYNLQSLMTGVNETVTGAISTDARHAGAERVCTTLTMTTGTGNQSSAVYTAELDTYATNRSLGRRVSLHTEVEECTNQTLSGPMPVGGNANFYPDSDATCDSISNVTLADGSAGLVYHLTRNSGLSQEWTVTAAAPHVPAKLVSHGELSNSEVVFASYEQIAGNSLGQYCDNATNFECTGLHCSTNPAAPASTLFSALSWACGQVDCSPLQQGAAKFYPNTVYAHANYAFNQYYLAHSSQGAQACNFGGAGLLVTCDSANSKCVPVSTATDAELETALAWLCDLPTQGVQDCSPIKPGGAHFLPNTTRSHASWAFDFYYQAYRCIPGWNSCDFSGAAIIENA